MAYAASDFVVSRAGLSTITELSNLGKVSVVVPMPNTHQEYNAKALFYSRSAIVFDQRDMTAEKFVILMRKLLFSPQLQKQLKNNISRIMPKNSSEKITKIIMNLIADED